MAKWLSKVKTASIPFFLMRTMEVASVKLRPISPRALKNSHACLKVCSSMGRRSMAFDVMMASPHFFATSKDVVLVKIVVIVSSIT